MDNLVTLKENEGFLRQISKPVSFDDQNLENDIRILQEYTYANTVYAMAAVQLGIAKRIVFVKSSTPGKSDDGSQQLLLINPKIISKKGKTTFWEACRSCIEYTALVERPYEIVVEYQTLDQETKTETFSGFLATVLSHELDHLDGILHMDRSNFVVFADDETRKKLREKSKYTILSTDCDFEYKQPQIFKKDSFKPADLDKIFDEKS